MVGSAYLRVFLPVESVPEQERVRAERAMVHRRTGHPVYRERGTGRLALLTAEEEGADVRTEEGRWYVCPWRTRLRILAGLVQLRQTIPSEVADELVPEPEARRAARELTRLRRQDPSAVPTLLESPWHVPVRWFVLFEDHERRLSERPEGGYRLTYWTSMSAARPRVRRAAEVLDRGGLDAVADMIRDMDHWLASFHPGAALELDYGDVAAVASWNELDDDHSAGQVQEALAALEAGDLDRAEELYQIVAGRWAEAKLRESLN